MAWFLPSYGRPQALAKMAEAPGGLPRDLVVILTDGDPARGEYFLTDGTAVMKAPAGSRLGDIWRWVFEKRPDEKFYGIVGDDHWAVTPGCWESLELAAGKTHLSVCAGGTQGENGLSVIGGTYCFGGDLVRAMGGIAPAGFRHSFIDNVAQQIASDFGLIRELPQVRIEHRHHLSHKDVPIDDTYKRGSLLDMDEDKKVFEAWLNSDARAEANIRIADMLGLKVSTVDLTKLQLAICIPMHDFRTDMVFEVSLAGSMQLFNQHGLKHTIHRVGGGSNIGKARERLLFDALDTQCTHLMFVDSDMGWEPKLPIHLLASGHDFTGAVGVKKVEELALCCNFFDGPQVFHEHTQFLKIKEVGFGFIVISRAAVERMIEAYPDLKYRGEKTGKEECALFLEMLDEGLRLSEDLAFCRRWSKIGGEIWIDHQIGLIHVGRKEYTGRPVDVFQVNKVPEPADEPVQRLEAAE